MDVRVAVEAELLEQLLQAAGNVGRAASARQPSYVGFNVTVHRQTARVMPPPPASHRARRPEIRAGAATGIGQTGTVSPADCCRGALPVLPFRLAPAVLPSSDFRRIQLSAGRPSVFSSDRTSALTLESGI